MNRYIVKPDSQPPNSGDMHHTCSALDFIGNGFWVPSPEASDLGISSRALLEIASQFSSTFIQITRPV